MKLHTRLLLSYGYLVALVLVGAAGAALGFFGLGNRIGIVLEDNFESVRASMDMLEALERQDSAVLTALLEFDSEHADVTTSEGAFLDALARARGNVTEASERPVLDTIASRFDAYRRARDQLIASRPERPLARYQTECFPAFIAVKEAVRGLLDLNHRAMVRADRDAQASAAQRALGYAALTAVGLLSMAWLSRGLRRSVISRLDELRSVADGIRGGDLRRRARTGEGDELDALAQALNHTLDEHDELRGRSEARLSGMRDLLRGWLECHGGPGAVVSLGGQIVVSNFDDPTTSFVVDTTIRLRSELPDDPSRREEREHSVEYRGQRLRFRLLTVRRVRAVGWWIESET